MSTPAAIIAPILAPAHGRNGISRRFRPGGGTIIAPVLAPPRDAKVASTDGFGQSRNHLRAPLRPAVSPEMAQPCGFCRGREHRVLWARRSAALAGVPARPSTATTGAWPAFQHSEAATRMDARSRPRSSRPSSRPTGPKWLSRRFRPRGHDHRAPPRPFRPKMAQSSGFCGGRGGSSLGTEMRCFA